MKPGEKFYAFEVLKGLAGRKVRFEREVWRGDLIILKGSTGVLMAPCHDEEGRIFAAVALDDPPLGLADDYDGEVHWLEGVNLHCIERDVLVV